MYYLQYLGSNLSPLNSQNVFVVVNAAHSQQVGTDSWIQALGLPYPSFIKSVLYVNWGGGSTQSPNADGCTWSFGSTLNTVRGA